MTIYGECMEHNGVTEDPLMCLYLEVINPFYSTHNGAFSRIRWRGMCSKVYKCLFRNIIKCGLRALFDDKIPWKTFRHT